MKTLLLSALLLTSSLSAISLSEVIEKSLQKSINAVSNYNKANAQISELVGELK